MSGEDGRRTNALLSYYVPMLCRCLSSRDLEGGSTPVPGSTFRHPCSDDNKNDDVKVIGCQTRILRAHYALYDIQNPPFGTARTYALQWRASQPL